MKIAKDAVDITTYFHLRLAADGTDATGLTVTNFDLQYVRSGATPAAKVDASALGAANSAHADNSAIEVDSTDQPGLYRVDWPDAAFATGVDFVYLTVKCATAFTETLRVSLESATPAVNVTQISGDSTAADNLELGYDGSAGAKPWHGIVDEGVAQSVGATEIVIRAGAAFANDVLIGKTVTLLDGTNIAACGIVTDYVGATDTATIGGGWSGGVTPTGTPAYQIWGTAAGADITTQLDAIEAAVVTNAAGADIAADIIALKAETAAILVDTGTTLDGKADAIKAKTDSLTFTVATVLDANIQRVNDVAIIGDGSGTPWAP